MGTISWGLGGNRDVTSSPWQSLMPGMLAVS